MDIKPYLCVKGASDAIAFYKAAFGATEPGSRILDNSGRVGHAEIHFGSTVVYLSDEHPEIGVISPATLGGSPVTFMIQVEDTDATYATALKAGAISQAEPEDQFYGERVGRVQDPFGFQWSIATQIEDLTDEEMQKRVEGEYSVTKQP